jgi:uncharacterized Tic20 family protein
MSRTVSIVMLLAGVLLFLASCAPFGIVLYQETLVEPVDSYTLSTEGHRDTAHFQLAAGKLARFAIKTDISTDSVQEDEESFDGSYLARFDFPISYSIGDSSGNTLLSKNISLDWKDSFLITKSNQITSSTGATLTAKLNLKKFTVPADGNINITIGIDPDTTYEAQLTSSELHLYENLVNNTGYIIAGVVMLVLGFILSVAGLIFLVISTVQASTVDSPDPGTLSNDQKANQDAMIIQLSALSGYVIPLGSLIVPLILWQIWKHRDSYVDEMGREAVNFQLSMIIYYLISLILCLLLIGFLLLFAVVIFHIAYIIIAAIQTSRGVLFRYPLTLRLIK